ncbi:MAG: hypothetical protein JKX81_01010 [Arenicella sp.]|nr:hypothetical protein [Arenicella sp.]
MNHYIHDVNALGSIESVLHSSRGLALLDAIFMPEWEFRYFSFNSKWNIEKREMMASMRDGQGNEYFLIFTLTGVVGKFLYEKNAEKPLELLSQIPNEFSSFKSEPAFDIQNTSFFIWRKNNEKNWCLAHDLPNNRLPMLAFLETDLGHYIEWAERYYDVEIETEVAQKVFSSLRVTQDDLSSLNPELTLDDLLGDIREIL